MFCISHSSIINQVKVRIMFALHSRPFSRLLPPPDTQLCRAAEEAVSVHSLLVMGINPIFPALA
jgi:hypothetical protein